MELSPNRFRKHTERAASMKPSSGNSGGAVHTMIERLRFLSCSQLATGAADSGAGVKKDYLPDAGRGQHLLSDGATLGRSNSMRDSPRRQAGPNGRAQSKRTRAQVLIALVGVLCIALPGFANDQVFEHVYPLPAGGSFLLKNENGDVQVDGWDRDEVEVRAVKRAKNDQRDLEQVKIDVESQPRQVAVHTLYPRGEGVEVAVEYHIHVPYRVLLGNIETVNGCVLVRGIDGGGELRSVNGDVEVLDSSGRFSAKTTNGNLHLELRKVLDGAPMNLETVNGSVVLGLPSNARANLKVLNMNGDFYSELPVTSALASPAARAFRAKLGVGGGEISVRTINGGIRLLREPPPGV